MNGGFTPPLSHAAPLAIPPGATFDLDSEYLPLNDGDDVVYTRDKIGGVILTNGSHNAPKYSSSAGISGRPSLKYPQGSGSLDTYLELPSAIGGGTANTIFILCQSNSPQVTGPDIQRTVIADGGNVAIGHQLGDFLYFTSAEQIRFPIGVRTGVPTLYTVLRNGSSVRLWINQSELATPAGAGSLTGTTAFSLIGGYYMYTGRVLYYPLALSDSAIAVAQESILRSYRTSASVLVLALGNSVTYGVGSTAGNDWPTQAATMLSAGFTVRNLGHPGVSTTQMVPLARYEAKSEARGFYDKSIAVVSEFVNDSAQGASTSQAITNFKSYCQALKTSGHLVIATTVHTTSFGGIDFATVNTELRNPANLGVFWDALADVAGTSELGSAGAASNATYYADSVHLTDAGYTIWARVVTAAIKTLIASL